MNSAFTVLLRPAHVMAMASLALSLSSCAMSSSWRQTHPSVAVQPPPPPLFEWTNEEATGSPSVKIALNEQKAYVYRGQTQVAWTTLASGVEKHPTPTGHFYVMEKITDKRSNLYGVIENADGEVVNWDAQAGVTNIPRGCHFVGAPMPHWMRLTGGGVGMHQGDIPHPGQPASHGCIRLPAAMADRLYSVVDVGTPVTVSGVAPY